MKKIKILTVSNTAWSDDNSFGLTYNSLFDGTEDYFEFANIYCNYGVPKNNCVKKYCQITEKTILKNIKNKNEKKCIVFDAENAERKAVALSGGEIKKYRNLKKKRFQISLWARDLIWKKGLKDTSEIVDFVKNFSPDIIFTPMYYMFHTNKILQTVINAAGVPAVAYISDDIYRIKKFLCSPLYAIDRLLKRKTIKKSIDLCDMLYVVCDEQKVAYEKEFNKPCKILRKPAEKLSEIVETISGGCKKLFVYAGNLGTGRWKTVAAAGKVIAENGGVLRVFSATPVAGKVVKLFKKKGVDYRGYVSAEKADEECRNSDVLVYAEDFGSKAVALTHFSVSTKFSSYLKSGKTILAAGPGEISAIAYLRREKAAIVAGSPEDFDKAVKECMKNDNRYVQNALMCAKRDFDKDKIQKMLKADIVKLAAREVTAYEDITD
ncbi:MAG: hypothetical protein IJZ94_00355 [Clostridia bacterium]|nr:hypothetical protein [Clostridia bacterium]